MKINLGVCVPASLVKLLDRETAALVRLDPFTSTCTCLTQSLGDLGYEIKWFHRKIFELTSGQMVASQLLDFRCLCLTTYKNFKFHFELFFFLELLTSLFLSSFLGTEDKTEKSGLRNLLMDINEIEKMGKVVMQIKEFWIMLLIF